MRWLVLVFIGLTGCSGNGPQVSPQPFSGPTVALDSSGPRHMVKVTAPTVGWSMRFDRARRQFEATEVFMTMTRPDPAFMHAQAEVLQFVDSTVPSRDPVVVYARVQEVGQAKPDAPYSRAASSMVAPTAQPPVAEPSK